jgi:putative membrane protein
VGVVIWPPTPTLIVAGHVLANTVWIGSLLAAAVLVAHAPWTAEPAEVGALARRVYVRLAVPAFLASLGAGVWRIALSPATYARLHWFHGKLAFALAVIVLHHVIGARTRRVASGRTGAAAGVDMLAFVTFVCAAGAVGLAIAKIP